MRWFRHAVVASSSLIASVCAADEPRSEMIRNPYVTAPAATVGQPTQLTPSTSTWQATVRPMSLSEPTPAVVAAPASAPVSRTLPSDCLQALRVAVHVRSTAEAYRAATVEPGRDKTAAWTASQKETATTMRDYAVKPAAWVEDAPNTATRPAGKGAPQMLSEVTTAHQEATRLTRNPYRAGEAMNRPAAAPAVPDGNPLR